MMKLPSRFCALLTPLAAVVLSCVSLTAQADTLADIYELALDNDALLKAKVAQYGADLELENLALAPLLPQAIAGYQISETETDTRHRPLFRTQTWVSWSLMAIR